MYRQCHLLDFSGDNIKTVIARSRSFQALNEDFFFICGQEGVFFCFVLFCVLFFLFFVVFVFQMSEK